MDTNQNQLATTQKLTRAPQMPGLLALPIKIIPKPFQLKAIEKGLNHFFKQALNDGELQFLHGRLIHVFIKDVPIDFGLRLINQKLQLSRTQGKVDLSLSTDVYTLLQLIGQQEDADGLFFSRRLDSQGDTELGLYVKNFLATLDPDESKLLSLAMTLSQQLLRLINHRVSRGVFRQNQT